MESKPTIDPVLAQAQKAYENDFFNSLKIVNNFINKKGLKQKAFMRAITAALEVGIVPENTKHTFQTNEEAMMAATLAKLIDLKYIIKTYRQYEKETGENTNGNK